MIGDHDLPPHDLPLHVGVGVVFAGAVVQCIAGARRRTGRAPPATSRSPGCSPRFVVVDEDRRGDVHRVNQGQAIPNSTFFNQAFHFAPDQTIALRLGTSIQISLVNVFIKTLEAEFYHGDDIPITRRWECFLECGRHFTFHRF